MENKDSGLPKAKGQSIPRTPKFFIAASAAEILFQIFNFVLYVNGPLSFVLKLLKANRLIRSANPFLIKPCKKS